MRIKCKGLQILDPLGSLSKLLIPPWIMNFFRTPPTRTSETRFMQDIRRELGIITMGEEKVELSKVADFLFRIFEVKGNAVFLF